MAIKVKILMFSLLTGLSGYAQVGIGPDSFLPEEKAMLEVRPGNDNEPKGLLIPRFNPAQETNIGEAPDGLLYYSFARKQFMFHNAQGFIPLNPWKISNDSTQLTFNRNPFVPFRVGIGTNEPQSTLDVNGTITATAMKVTAPGTIEGFGTIPVGGIIMWAGENVPHGWALCDGQNNTPDLRGRFVVGSGTRDKLILGSDGNGYTSGTLTHAVSTTGGFDEIALSTNQMPLHNHSGTTSTNGSHLHWIEGTDAGGLAWRTRTISGNTTVDMGWGTGDPGDEQWRGRVNTDNAGSHTHTFSTTNTGSNHAHENRPPYYVLAFIMRVQ